MAMCKSLACLTLIAATACVPATDATPSPATAPMVIATPTEFTCTIVSLAPTPAPGADSRFPPLSAQDRVRGAAEPVVTFVEYGDFVDPNSAALAEALRALVADYPQDVRVAFRPFPLSAFDKSQLAAQAVEAAGLQGQFWELHDLLYAQQDRWAALSVQDFEQWLGAQAAGLGMDAAMFRADLKSEAVAAKVQQYRAIGIPGTPVLLINGEVYAGPRDFYSLERITRLIMLGERQFTSCPPMTIDLQKQYLAILHTEKGEVVIALFPEAAPLTVNSFVFLARQGWFEEITFHRVIPGFVVQTGDPSGTGEGNPGYFFMNEINPHLKFDRAGRVGMANAGADTNGSQFFITMAPAPHLDGKYTIFGQVLRGMEVLTQITPRDPQPGTPLPPGDRLIGISIEEK